jgi:hypothetical protein
MTPPAMMVLGAVLGLLVGCHRTPARSIVSASSNTVQASPANITAPPPPAVFPSPPSSAPLPPAAPVPPLPNAQPAPPAPQSYTSSVPPPHDHVPVSRAKALPG